MKKLRLFMLVGVILCCLMALAGCKDATAISTPKGLRLDEATLTLRWGSVANAKAYQLDIDCEDNEKNSKRKEVISNSDDLTSLGEGVYTIRVRAIAKNGYENSKWSEKIPFEREKESGLIYKLINANTEYKVSSFGSAKGEVEVVDTYRGKPVTTIGEEAFTRCENITKVIIPEGITTIEKRAFFNCFSLTEVSIPSTVTTIGERAFMGCQSLKKVKIPDAVTDLPQRIFSGCVALEEIEFGAETKTVGDYAFANCSSLMELNLPDTITSIGQFSFSECLQLTWLNTGNGLVSIGDSAFYKCVYLEEVVLGTSVKTIGKQAFAYNSKLEKITIPDNVESILDAAFFYCTSLSDVEIGAGVKQVGYLAFALTDIWNNTVGIVRVDDWIVGCTVLDLTSVAGLLTVQGFLEIDDGIVGVADASFENCYGATQINFHDSVKYIGAYAAPAMTNVMAITFGSGIEEIGESAFRNCTALGTIVFKNSTNLKKIGNYAFAGCKNLSVIEKFPDKVQSIGTYAFSQTPIAKNTENNAYYEEGFIRIGDWVVGYIGSNDKISIPNGVKGISAHAFYSRNTITEITIPESVEIIDQAAFYGCMGLKKVVFNGTSQLKGISSYAFTKCEALETIEIPASVKQVGDYAFYGCTALKKVVLKDGVEVLGNYVFYGCTALEQVDLGSTLTTMGGRVFSRCTALTTLTLPDSLTTMGDYTFYQCESLLTVKFGSGLKEVNKYTFADCGALNSIILPQSIKKIEKFAFYRCEALKSVVLGDNVTEICNYAFYGCKGLKYLNIPDSVTTIGGFVFRGCESLTCLMIGENVQSVADYAFYGANSLTIYAESKSCPKGWKARWNMSYRPVIWGCTFSEEEYTISFTMAPGAIENVNDLIPLTMPMKRGYTCVGWTSVKGSNVAEYTVESVVNAPEGTVLYACWKEGEPQDPQPVPTPQEVVKA